MGFNLDSKTLPGLILILDWVLGRHAVKHQGRQPPCGYYANATLQDWGNRHRSSRLIWVFPEMVGLPNKPIGFPTKNDHFGVEIGGTI